MAKNERRFDGDVFLLVGKGLTPRRHRIPSGRVIR